MPKQITDKEYSAKIVGVANELLARSYNKDTTLSEDTKLVIVGTLTPPKTAYFYCSFYNRIYGYIDQSLKELGRSGGKTLKELKIGLQEVHNNRTKIELLDNEEIKKRVGLIKKVLSENRIAFLDVMDNVIRKKESPYDNDIDFYTLAESDFKDIRPTMTVIANSKLAKDCAIKMGVKDVTYLSQRSNTKCEWVDKIVKAIK